MPKAHWIQELLKLFLGNIFVNPRFTDSKFYTSLLGCRRLEPETVFIMVRKIFGKIMLGAWLIAIAMPLHAQDAEEFYDGNVIRWIVPYKPGGGYDEYSRLIAPYLEKYSGSKVEILNTPGSGGMRGAVEIFKAPADGLHMGIINGGGLVYNTISGAKQADYDLGEFTYFARVSAEERVMIVNASSDLTSFDAVMSDNKPLIVGTTGLGGGSNLDATMAGYLFEIDQKVIVGFDNSADLRLALLRGDIDAMWSAYGSALDGITNGDFRALLRTGSYDDSNAPETMSVSDVAQSRSIDDQRVRLLDAWLAMEGTGRPLVGPAGIPEDRVAYLREVFITALNDPEFRTKAKEAGRGLSVLSGDDMHAVVLRAVNIDDETRTLLSGAATGNM